ncbi:MAG: DUF2273 domain-containing protein [Desulfosporosinus sp.]
MGEKLARFFGWAIDNHPAKLIGTSLGFVLGMLLITFGFWRTLVLALFIVLGFVIGKLQDDHKFISTWLEKILNGTRRNFP